MAREGEVRAGRGARGAGPAVHRDAIGPPRPRKKKKKCFRSRVELAQPKVASKPCARVSWEEAVGQEAGRSRRAGWI